MNKSEIETNNPTENIKLYSKKAIGIATYLGGPLAAGYMIGENYKALNQPTEGRNSLFIGIISTIALFLITFLIPEDILNKIPGLLIPLVYTVIILSMVENLHGEILKSHKEYENEFYSGWKAAGIGLISLLITLIIIFGFSLFELNFLM